LDQDWLQSAGVVARDIHYYGNANADDVLVYELNALEHQDRRLTMISSLYRSVDEKLIARMTTTKELAEGVVLKKRTTPREHSIVETLPESPSSVAATPSTESEVLTLPAAKSEGRSEAKVGYDQATLNQIIIDFLSSMLEVSDLTPQSDLHALGIESMVYQELSDFLKDTHQLPNNPSRFYGTSTIAALTDDLLESLSEGQPSSSLDTPQERSRVSTAVSSTASSEAIAIIGMNGRFPGSPDVETFWEHLQAGKDLITEVPKDRWDWEAYYGDPQQEQGKTKSKWGGFIEGIDAFDPLFFGISPHEAMLMDPQQRLTLEAAWHALEDAAIAPSQLKGSDAGVFLGVSGSDYAQLLQTAGKSTEAYDALGSAASMLANRVSYFLDVHGPSQVIDTACSSSLVAVHEAVRNLKDGSCGLALAGGVSALLSPKLTLAYSQAGMLSEDGRCKAFDQRADGYVRSEGIGVLVLKRLADAERDGDRIYGVIRGSAVNHGGKANTLTAPNPEAQKALLVAAYQSGDVDPAQVSYLEAHGTGTSLGDPIEMEGIKGAFKELYKNKGSQLPTEKRTSIGSVKTNVGHLEAAAGITGLIKVLLSMEHQLLPGNAHLQAQNSYIDLADTPFELQRETTSWATKDDQPRLAGVSSFGSGGTNAHVVIEEYRDKSRIKKESLKLEGPFIVPLSARNEARLEKVVQKLANYLAAPTKTKHLNLPDLAYTLQTGREVMECRLAMVVHEVEELQTQLTNYQRGDSKDLLIGNIKENKSDFLLEGEAGEAYIRTAISKKQSKALAQLWVRGVSIDWNLLYEDGQKPNKISLPTYPFARERYWIPVQDNEHATLPSKKSLWLHPLLHRNDSNLQEQRFTSVYSGKEPFLSDHKVQGEKVLPGVAYLELAREAGTRSLEQEITQLKDIAWLRPVRVNGQAQTVQVSIYEEGERLGYEVYSLPSVEEGLNGKVAEEVIHSQGWLSTQASTPTEAIDISALQARLPREKTGEACYASFRELGLDYGTTFQGIATLYYDDN
ncbi:MAG: type I polyketide synthase, partial [Verrucomicrobiota bacterium]